MSEQTNQDLIDRITRLEQMLLNPGYAGIKQEPGLVRIWNNTNVRGTLTVEGRLESSDGVHATHLHDAPIQPIQPPGGIHKVLTDVSTEPAGLVWVDNNAHTHEPSQINWPLYGGVVLRTTVQAIPNGALTPIDFDYADINIGPIWDVAQPKRLVAPVAGYYAATAGWGMDANQITLAARMVATLRRNGTHTLARNDTSTVINKIAVVGVARGKFYMNAGDYIEFLVLHDQPGPTKNSLAATLTSQHNCFATLDWVGGQL